MLPLRDDNPRFSFPVVTLVIIILNFFVFIFFMQLSPNSIFFVNQYALYPSRILNMNLNASIISRSQLRLLFNFITCIFMHGSWTHLIGNCWFLWIFGDNIEGAMGHLTFLFFYLFCGVLASLAHIFTTYSPHIPVVGASGAIAGIMGAYFVLYPRAKIYTFVPLIFIWILPVPAFIFLVLWFASQLFSGLTGLLSPGQGVQNIAFWSHISGFVIGVSWGIFFINKVKRMGSR